MKKIVLSIISILSVICLTFGIAGCNKNVAPTEELPREEISSGNKEQPTGSGNNNVTDSNGGNSTPQPPNPVLAKKVVTFSEFDKFKAYYETDFRADNPEKFYLLYPEMESINGGFKSSFSIIGEETFSSDDPFINPVLEEYIAVYSEELGTGVNLSLDTGAPAISLDMGMTLYSVSQNHEQNKDFVFEFSEYSGKFKWQYTIRIFENETLIGECFYYQTVDIPQSWMENYLKENLI